MSTMVLSNNHEDPLGICEYMGKKLDALRIFYSVTESIKKILDSGDVDDIDRLILERQKCMDTIGRIDDYIVKIRNDNPAYLSSRPDKTKALRKILNGKIEKTLKEICALDKENSMTAASHHDAVRQELLKMIHNRHGLHGYRDNNTQKPRFLDMKL
jgi:hypothetical protein